VNDREERESIVYYRALIRRAKREREKRKCALDDDDDDDDVSKQKASSVWFVCKLFHYKDRSIIFLDLCSNKDSDYDE